MIAIIHLHVLSHARTHLTMPRSLRALALLLVASMRPFNSRGQHDPLGSEDSFEIIP